MTCFDELALVCGIAHQRYPIPGYAINPRGPPSRKQPRPPARPPPKKVGNPTCKGNYADNRRAQRRDQLRQPRSATLPAITMVRPVPLRYRAADLLEFRQFDAQVMDAAGRVGVT
jgi:hypothetical protein